MVDNGPDEEALDRLFHALADRTRRAILRRLTTEDGCAVTVLAEPFDMSLNAVSKHLKVLEAAGLLTRSKDGRVHRLSANFDALTHVAAVVREYQVFWNARFDDLDDYLEQTAPKAQRKTKRGKRNET